MSFFSKILDKLGLGKGKDQPSASTSTPTPVAAPPKPTATTQAAKPATPTAAKPAMPTATTVGTSAKPVSTVAKAENDDMVIKREPVAVPAAPKAMSQVDVMNMLEQKAKGTGLNWKQSISDLLFLLELDNSREARTELAKELNAPADVMTDSARMNTWLHKEVLRKIAENGGNIPQELLD